MPESHEEKRARAVEEASVWLGKLERTLRPTETAQLREWLKVRLHREVIVERCKLWHGPEILAVLNELFVVERPPRPPDLTSG